MGFRLLEDGTSKRLLEDGTSKLLMEDGGSSVPTGSAKFPVIVDPITSSLKVGIAALKLPIVVTPDEAGAKVASGSVKLPVEVVTKPTARKVGIASIKLAVQAMPKVNSLKVAVTSAKLPVTVAQLPAPIRVALAAARYIVSLFTQGVGTAPIIVPDEPAQVFTGTYERTSVQVGTVDRAPLRISATEVSLGLASSGAKLDSADVSDQIRIETEEPTIVGVRDDDN